jgi:cell division protein FtsZ
MGTGEAAGEERARLAAEEAIHNPLLDDISLKGARGLLVSIIGGHDLTLYEVDAAASRVRQEVDPDANIIVGATFDETLGDRVRVSIVASGMMRGPAELAARKAAAKQPPPLPGANTANSATPPPMPPAGSSQVRSQSEFERRLADALEPGHGYPTKFDGQLGAAAQQRQQLTHSDSQVRRSDVTVEVREPQYLDHLNGNRSAMSGDSGLDLPGAQHETVETLTMPPRGMPRPAELQDFPQHAQQEYRVRVEGHVPLQQAVPLGAVPNVAAAKKPSIFQRITGAGRVTT